MALTRIDSYLVDLDSLGGITFDDQAGTPTLRVDATTHRVGIGTASPTEVLDVAGNIKATSFLGNATTSGSLATARTIELSGAVTGSVSFDGSADVSITTTIADSSNIDGFQSALDAKAPLASPALTGTPTAPTATAGTNTTQLATTAFVSTALANLVDSAPATLDTLNELAAALGDDANFSTTVTNSIATKLDASSYTASDVLTKIKTVDGDGSGLDADQLDGQEGTYYLNYNNFTNTPTIPTNNNQLTNGAGYLTSFDITTQTDPKYLRSDTNDSMSGQLSITGTGQYVGNYGYSTIVLQDTSGYPGIDFRSGTKDWLQRMEAGDNMQWVYRNDGNYSERMELSTGGVLTVNSNTVWHAGNDGSGSGLDADTLDGQQGSYYRQSWPNIDAGTRTNYTLKFQPPASNYAGFEFTGTNGSYAGYFLIRGTSDSGVYTAEGITLVADQGWLTLAQRNVASRGVRIMSGTTSTERLKVTTAGNIQFVNGASFTYNGNTIWNAGNDGSGSGLDADLLDGQQGSYYLNTSTTFGGDVSGTYNAIVVANDSHSHSEITTKGTYIWTASSAPRSFPLGVSMSFVRSNDGWQSFGSVLNMRGYSSSQDGSAAQFYFPYNSTYGGNSMQYRLGLYSNAGWTAWKTPWDNTNDGAGSGLDADTLDGINSGSFLRSDTNDSFTGQISMATQKALIASDYGHGVYGVYSPTRYQHVWSMGTSYNLPSNGLDESGAAGNLYGLAWSYNPNYSYQGSNPQAKAGLNHQLLLMMNGITYTALGNGIWTSGNATIGGSVTATGNINSNSDIKLKTNIKTISNPLDKVIKLRGVEYNRIDMDNEKQIGLIAQEVEKIIPELVGDNEGTKTVSYGNITAVLIEAIKEQQKQIEELKSEIEGLKNK